MTKIVHIEITSGDVDATARFYSQVFGWRAEPSPLIPDYIMLDSGTVTGAVMSDTYKDQKVIAWYEVEDIDAALKAITAVQGRQLSDINTIPGQGKVVYAADINGTVFGLKQPG